MHAIVYVPGLSRAAGDTESETVTARFQGELARRHPLEVFTRAEADEIRYGEDAVLRAVRRRISSSQPNRPPVDVVLLDHRQRLVGDWHERWLLMQVLALTVYLLGGFAKALRPWRKTNRRHGKGALHRIQAVWMLAVLALVSVYFAFLVGALVVAVQQQLGGDADGDTDAPPAAGADAPPAADADGDAETEAGQAYVPPAWWTATAQWIERQAERVGGAVTRVIGTNAWSALLGIVTSAWSALLESEWVASLAVLLGLALLLIRRSREAIEAAAVTYIGAWEYLGRGHRQAEVVGQLTALLEHLEGEGYEHVSVVAFSFGTLVAMDALFPFEEGAPPSPLRVHELVTIGSPFDLTRTFFARYTEPRASRVDQDNLKWRNVYCPQDVLGSNFRTTEKQGQATQGIHVLCPEGGAEEGVPQVPVGEVTPAPPIDEVTQAPLIDSRPVRAAAAVALATGLTVGLMAASPLAGMPFIIQLLLVACLVVVVPVSLHRLWPGGPEPSSQPVQATPPSQPAQPTAKPTKNCVYHAGGHGRGRWLTLPVPPGVQAHGWYFSQLPDADDARRLMLPDGAGAMPTVEPEKVGKLPGAAQRPRRQRRRERNRADG